MIGQRFDALYSLDKDPLACAIASQVKADGSWGFTLKEGCCHPINALAEEAWEIGLFDPISRANRKSYPQMLFDICGFSFKGEPYLMAAPKQIEFLSLPGTAPMVGLNIGCGDRWPMRRWPDTCWETLAMGLQRQGAAVLILGGAQEHECSQSLARQTGAIYPGVRPLEEFFSLVNRCDLVVTSVSMAMHVALALRKRLVLLNNIFNKHEFELYGLGEILEPMPACECYYPTACDRNCMSCISPEAVLRSCLRQLESVSLLSPMKA